MRDRSEQPSGSELLRNQEAEFYEQVLQLMASLPRGTTVADALETPEGQRIRTKWMLKNGRQPPL